MLELREENEMKTMRELCHFVKAELDHDKYKECENRICKAMAQFPDAPEPHNLFGILAEKKGRHASAMRHFRASLDLMPTYKPASQNLRLFGELFCSMRLCAYDEEDCIPMESDEAKAHVERIF